MKLIIEKHSDGYCGYPLGFSNGAIVGQGNTYLEALQSTEGSIQAFFDYYGKEEFEKHLFIYIRFLYFKTIGGIVCQ